MPAKSKAQQKFMGMVYKCKTSGECASPAVKKAAKSLSKKDAKDFASTKRKGLPNKITEKVTFKDFLMETYKNELTAMDNE